MTRWPSSTASCSRTPGSATTCAARARLLDRDAQGRPREARLRALPAHRPGLVIPIRDARGRIVNYQIRPDQPRIGDNGRPVKYESPGRDPADARRPAALPRALGSPHATLWITEGARKADAARQRGALLRQPARGLVLGEAAERRRPPGAPRSPAGQARGPQGGRSRSTPTRWSKPQVHKALEALAALPALAGRAGEVLYLPELEPGVKCGLDDFLAGHAVEELWQHVEDELRAPPEPKAEARPALPTAMLLALRREAAAAATCTSRTTHGLAALALYVLHTWAIDAVDVHAVSLRQEPAEAVGQDAALEVLELVCRLAAARGVASPRRRLSRPSRR